jgi:hypothetical protein
MKFFSFFILFFLSLTVFAQRPCEFDSDVTDSLGTYKATKDYLIYEKIFAGDSNYIFTSLVLTDGIPTLSIQFIEKSNDFIKARCFDKNSKIYLQLNDGKIVTLIHINQDVCGTMVRDEKGFNNRILTGIFMFQKEGLEDLKKSPVNLMRIKYASDQQDFIFKKELKSELDGKMYEPENYFVNYLHCIFDKH